MSKLPILTPLELKVMDVLWKLKRGFVKDILEHWPEEDKPAYNTISTIVRILEDPKKEKCYIGHIEHGRTHEYVPLVSKEEYQQVFLENAVEKVFEGSIASLLTTLMDGDKVSKEELDELKRLLGQK